MVEHLLEVRNLTKIFLTGSILKKELKAVDSVSFEMSKDKASITTLAGESGSGKSTIAKLLLNLEEPTSGEVLYNCKNLSRMSKKEQIEYRREVQPIFQNPYSVFNPFYKTDRIFKKVLKKSGMASSRIEEQKLIRTALEENNIAYERVLGKFPHELSGGELQRCMVVRAFLTRPKLIIADEPVSMVDASLRAGILRMIMNLKEKHQISFLYITHDLSTAYNISDNIMILYRGSIMESGEIGGVLGKPLHPYLQELLECMPIPDPEKQWKKDITLETEQITYATMEHGCKFYGRCPKRVDKCLRTTPRLSSAGPGHNVACHLVE
jgi:peptide/nickel transport system ATP-binding protein